MNVSLALVPALGIFSFSCVALSKLNSLFLALSYYILFCHACFVSLRSLVFSNGRQRVDPEKREHDKELVGVEGGVNHNQDILFEKIIYDK